MKDPPKILAIWDELVALTEPEDGAGIPEDFREKVKERFFRTEADRHTSGHGLELSLVNAVAVLHHGTLVLTDNQLGPRAQLTIPMPDT
jgi:signal transduction histidine kinase